MRATTGLTLGLLLMLTGCGGADVAGERASSQGPEVSRRGQAPAPGSQPGSTATTVPTPAVPEALVEPDTERGTVSGSNDWRVHRPSYGHQIEAFTTRTSGRPGIPVGLKVSTTAGHFRVSAYRIGAYDGGWGHRVWRSSPRPGRVQPSAVMAPAGTRTVVAPWRRDLTVDTADWSPGFYVFKLRGSSGWETLVPYVVSSPSAAGTVALVVPVTTWQAYNRWGGYSLYAGPEGDRRSWAVSFDRPYNLATGANDYRTAALPLIVRAEELGVPLSYYTNVDLHARPGTLEAARGYMSLGHDEYWTTGMRREVMRARDGGTNLAFLGANTMYWRVRLADRPTGRDRLLVGYRDDAHLDPVREATPTETSARFRDLPAPMPEHELIGLKYECYPVDTDYVVTSPDWWGFHGTGVRRGDHVPGLVGPEADRVYPDARTPRPLQILSEASYDCRGVTTVAHSAYYTTPSGSGVFAAGTLRWGCALVDDCERPLGERTARFVHQVTGNLVREFARGPVGATRPARDNLDAFDLSLVNTVGAS